MLKHKLGKIGLLLISLMLAGCLVSATFVIVETFSFSAQSGFYFYPVDITTDSDWQDHKDNIDFIDAAGAEFFITSNETQNVTFNVWIDDPAGVSNPGAVPSTATKIISGFTVPPGVSKITYAQSLGLITGLSRLKQLAKTGIFDLYATSTGNTGTSFVIDSARIIVTVSASGS